MSFREVCAVRLWQLTDAQLKAVLKIQRLNLVAEDPETVEVIGLKCLGLRSKLFELALCSADGEATRLLRIYLAVKHQHLLYSIVVPEDGVELNLLLRDDRAIPNQRV